MDKLIDKISSYDIFNYLFPGVIFTIVLSKISPYNLIQADLLTGAFVYYFIGMIIGRIGSVVVEPILKWCKFVRFARYSDYVKVVNTDTGMALLVEKVNMFRAFVAVFMLLLSEILIDRLHSIYPDAWIFTPVFMLSVMLILFLYSYKKQVQYVAQRITAHLDN